MKASLFTLAAGLAFTVTATPFNAAALFERALTPDNSCGLVNGGNNKGYTCDPTLPQGGRCCSASGFCGNSDSYCGAGCQPAYGSCGTSSSSSPPPTTSTSSGTAPVGTSTDGCGPTFGNLVCAPGYCCSGSGYCGKSNLYCGSTCQPAFGSCGISSTSTVSATTSSASSSSTPVGTSTNECGPKFGNAICAAGLCCSQNGYCGQSDLYCGAGCQSAFGGCGTHPSSSTSASGPGPTGSTDLCGPGNGNAVCATGLCCSSGGYCGTGSQYCADPDCQFNFGTCDSDMTPAGTSTINDPRPLFGKISYTNDIYDCAQANIVALTYDDGPLNYTNQLLDILKQYNFKATFFITGNNVHKGMIDVTAPYPAVIKRMIAEGHQVASHTWSHYDLSALTKPQRIQQMVKNERAIANIIGKYPTYMRPPYSSCDDASGCTADMQSLGYHRTYFDLDTQDYLNPNTIQNSKDIVRWALGNATQGSDFLSIQHDVVQQSVANLSSYYFDLIQRKGWRGVTAGECLGDPESNWYRVPGTGQPAPVSLSSSSTATSSTIASSSGTSRASSTASAKPPTTTGVKTTTTPTATKASSTLSSKISTATAPVATSKCDQPQSGNFCGKVKSFASQPGCNDAHTDCKNQQNACPRQGGSRTACANWARECVKLNKYCSSCEKKRACDDKGFRASEE